VEKKTTVIPSVSGERRGTELVAESGLNGLELWQKRCFVIGVGLAKFNVQSKPIAEHNPSCEY